MKKNLRVTISLAILFLFVANGRAQQVAVKNNLFYDAAFLTPNASIEVALGKKHTMDIMGALNPFTYKDNKKFKLWMVQPEWRYWFCSRFNGWFLGLHAHGGQFNVGNYKLPFGVLPTIKNHRYEGWFAGGGLSIGYQWALSKHWGLETEIGGGYTYFDYKKFNCAHCGTKEKDSAKGFWGPTRAAVSLVYLIK
jgi:hypothetical protein